MPSLHVEWLSLLEVSGPFLAVPVLDRVFPQGLEVVDTPSRQRLRQAYEEWRDAVDAGDPELAALHDAWVRMVLQEALEFDARDMKSGDAVPEGVVHVAPEHGVTIRPDHVLVEAGGSGGTVRMLLAVHSPDTDLAAPLKEDGWMASPMERMTVLCRSSGIRLGLVTNGERWMLVDAPVGATAGYASWYSRLWWQEPLTFRAFVTLLGIRRFYAAPGARLETLLDESLKFQEDVTETLGEQVRRAVEVLVQALDRADVDRNRDLLREVSPPQLYEAGLTVMMRLVFLLCAEERGLLLSGDSIYDEHYAVSTLRGQLREAADRVGVEVLGNRWDAWSRLLAIFRAVYGGVEHESLRLPALGGSLFDPDRFPFLEGRDQGSRWRETMARPLPIDNRTVLLLLDALQMLEGRTLSYRVLDVEQIGYVYEGLLERTVKRVPRVSLGLIGSGKAKNPNVELSDLESASLDGRDALVARVVEITQRSRSAIDKALGKGADEATFVKLLSACHGKRELAERIQPYLHLTRLDSWGYPLIYPEGAFIVTLGSDRRETGTHYTPKSLTETIVKETLEPVAYVGPAEGTPRENWRLKSPSELLDLKICDPAMGSGAFLVQACRWIAERVVEAWEAEEAQGKVVESDGDVISDLTGRDPAPTGRDERLVLAKRLVAERCLYGVDVNPLAVELAKLSIWLVTLAKGRPFGFLDHNLKSGDSLLGIHRLEQLVYFSMHPETDGRRRRLFATNIESAVQKAIALRMRLRATPIRDIRDVEAMARLDDEARKILEGPELVADALVGEVLASGGNERALERAIQDLAIEAGRVLDGDGESWKSMRSRIWRTLSVGAMSRRNPFHWPLEFPEVLARNQSGFSTIVSNPPFMGGLMISSSLGMPYRKWLDSQYPHGSGRADICVYFSLRLFGLITSVGGTLGMIATNTVSEGESRETGLQQLINEGACLFRVIRELKWPGHANLTVTILFFTYASRWIATSFLNDKSVDHISASLTEEHDVLQPFKLYANRNISFQGANVHGMGFICENAEAKQLLDSPINSECLYRFMIGDDLNNDPMQQPSRWVIDFRDRPLDECELKWPDLIDRIRSLVKPFRDIQKDKRAREKWWWHYRPAAALYLGTRGMTRFLAVCEVTKHLSFSFVKPGWVISSNVDVIALDGYEYFALLQSSIHEIWARRWCSRLETRLKYSNGNAFETFPFPLDMSKLSRIGKIYYCKRDNVMRLNSEGLTKTYNRYHDQDTQDPRILELRNIQCKIDTAVIDSYGWNDLNLDHGFREVPYLQGNDRIRFTLSEPVRIEVLRRLSELNLHRYEEEVRQGLHDKQGGSPTGNRVRKGKSPTSGSPTLPGFDFAEPTKTSAKPDEGFGYRILTFLINNPGWHGKDAILSGTSFSAEQWLTTIRKLMDDGLVEKRGERRGTEYRAIQ